MVSNEINYPDMSGQWEDRKATYPKIGSVGMAMPAFMASADNFGRLQSKADLSYDRTLDI